MARHMLIRLVANTEPQGVKRKILLKAKKIMNLMIVDDHKIFRDGLKLLLSHFPFVENIHEASNGREFLDQVSDVNPDIVLMDINMPLMGGIETTIEALDRYPDLKIIVLTTFHDDDYVEQMMLAGVEGYMLKRSTPEEFEKALLKVHAGGNYFSDEIVQVVMNNFNRMRVEKEQRSNLPSLTGREMEVLELICEGYNNEQVAELIYVSSKTVEKYKSSLFQKTGTNNTVNLIIYAFKHRLVEAP
jgi:DNA-binding NarL/FixJ family response regulator